MPPGILAMGQLALLSAPIRNENAGDGYPHLLAGDFNTTIWQELYGKWTQ